MFGGEDIPVSQEDGLNKKKTAHRTGPCPSCQKKNAKLDRTINKRGISISTCAHRSIPQQLISEGVGEDFKSKCFAVCQICYTWSIDAIKAADIQLKGQLGCLSQKPKRSKATILQSPLYCGEGNTLV